MSNIAFATCKDEPNIIADDVPAADALLRAGVAVTPVVWDGADSEWDRFDAVIIRSVWDYFRKPQQFEQWVRRLMSCPTQLWNPPSAVLWNTNKHYLLDLAGRGISVVPTEYLPAAASPDLRAVLEKRGWCEAVVKPAIAAGSHGAWRTSLSSADADQPRLAEQLSGGDVLVQSYMPEIESRGEWSLGFFGLEYSHAVLKQPCRGDFRVQEHLGGRTLRAEPDPGLICQARAAVAAAGQALLYARVDGVERDGQLFLMELEIIEPFLFLSHGPGAPQRFAESVLRVLAERK